MSPTVSVIIPTYNRWPMVGEAIESVLAQSYRSWELIVVDDGSTDDTSERLALYGSKIKYISRQRSGVAAARNHGIASATGQYVAFLDSDDLWMPRKLEVQTAFMEQHPNVQICQTEEIWIRRGVRVNPKAKHAKPSGDIFRSSLDLCLVSPSAVMMSKPLFTESGGFDESFPVCEDYDLWLRISVHCSVPLIPVPLVVKRGGHSDQLSHYTWGMDRYRVRSLRKLSVLCQGARKRGKEYEATAYESMLSEVLQETLNVGDPDSPICEREGIPSATYGTVVGLGSTR